MRAAAGSRDQLAQIADPPDLPGVLAEADQVRAAGRRVEAIDRHRRALEREPANLHALYWLATLSQEAGDLAAATQYCEQGLAIDPDQIGLLLRRGSVATDPLDPLRALECYERVARLDPEVPEIHAMLADQYCHLGRIEEGAAAFERALGRTPDSVRLQSNRLFVLNYGSTINANDLFEAHRAWGAMHEAQISPGPRPHAGTRDPERRLRIGYVSPDLREHAVAFFVEPLFRHHDRTQFDVVCFDTSPYPADGFTARLRDLGPVWRRVGDLDSDQLADAIRASAIDVLVDLSGHSTFHRLLAFARRPAPVQATWLGYLSTTGLTTMDYRITDAYLDPEGRTERLHTERLFRLPHHSCFVPSPLSPPVGPLPARSHGAPTFGSVNQWSKVTAAVKDTWAKLLKEVPESRLLVVARGVQNRRFRDLIIAEFVERGVRSGQVEVVPFLPLQDFLALLGRIDVALDPFPYGGGTTTLHSLWMGVPVVTLAGEMAFSRNAIGPLTLAGLDGLIAGTADEYVTTAARLVQDRGTLATLRAGLRERVRASGLTDAVAFTRNMELAYRAMWRNHCEGRATRLCVG